MENIFERKSIENLINSTMQNLHALTEANTIVGEKIIAPDGTTIVPISKITVGYVVGGGEYTDITRKKKIENYPLAGGSGGGVSITPVGFLITGMFGAKYIDVENKNAVESVLKILNKLTEKYAKNNQKKEDKKNEK